MKNILNEVTITKVSNGYIVNHSSVKSTETTVYTNFHELMQAVGYIFAYKKIKTTKKK